MRKSQESCMRTYRLYLSLKSEKTDKSGRESITGFLHGDTEVLVYGIFDWGPLCLFVSEQIVYITLISQPAG